MNSFRLNMKLGHILYSFIVILAVVLRFIWLSEFPLSNPEASAALQAAQSTPYASAFFPGAYHSVPQPAYEIFTRVLFQIFGAEDIFARLIPALAGILLVLTPLLARKRIGFGHSLLMGFLLTISPIFVTLSRTASGTSLSALGLMAFLMAVIGKGEENKNSTYLIAGFGLGLALTSGPYIFSASLSIGLGLLLWRIIRSRKKMGERAFSTSVEHLRLILWTSVIAVFSFATGIGWSIQGIARFFDSAAYWIRGWSGESPFTGLTYLVIIPAYMPMLILLGIFGAWSSFRERDKLGSLASLVAFVGLLVSLFYPSRQPHDLLWVALPLAYLGSKYLLSIVQNILDRRITPWVLAVSLIFIVLAFMAYLQISSTAAQDLPIDIFDAWQVPFAFLTLMFVIASFFGLGWNWISAKLSVNLALFCITFILSVSALWRLNFTSQVYSAKELWRNNVPSQGLRFLVDTVETTSQSSKGVDEGLNVEIIGEAPTYLIWALREYRPQVGSEGGGLAASPIILVKADKPELILQADYVGQTIAIGEKWGWDSILPPDFLKWWVRRNPPTLTDEWLVLIRQDIALILDS